MIDRINDFAARQFGGVGATKASMIRIHVWALAFLILVAGLAPAARERVRVFGVVQPLALAQNDQRAYTSSPYGKQAFHIAWIHASEGNVVNANGGFPSPVGQFLAASLPRVDGRPVAVDTYSLLGMRLGDIYMTLLRVLEAKPDVVVLSLNPVWVMNPFAVHEWPQLDALTARDLVTRPAQWPVGAALFSPSDLLWGVAGSRLPAIRERSYWSSRVHDVFDDFGPLDRSQLEQRASVRKPSLSQRLVGAQPLSFWAAYRLHITPTDQFGTFFTRGPEQWAKWVDASNQGGNQFNAMLLREMAAELRAAKIPSVVYMAQANRDWIADSPSFARAIGGVERQVGSLSGSFRADNVLFEPLTLNRFVPDLKFVDETHISGAGSLGPYFAAQVCRVLAQSGRGSGCHPIDEGNTGG